MLASRQPPRRYTLKEYFEFEEQSVGRHEYHDGYLFALSDALAMAGGSFEHSQIIANVIGELGNALKGKPCRVLDGNMLTRIGKRSQYVYPDVTVVCGPPEFDPDSPPRMALLNPRVIVEVLSPSTEQYDRTAKFDLYREIESLEQYVIIAQDVPSVQTFQRRSDGTWVFDSCAKLDGRLRISALGIEVPMAEIYAHLEMPSGPVLPLSGSED
jgi:Uma2 family endonuclease